MAGLCEWFALCGNRATTTEPHPILGNVPLCARCKAKVDALREPSVCAGTANHEGQSIDDCDECTPEKYP